MNSPVYGNGPEMKALLAALTAFKEGTRGVRLPADWTGTSGEVARTFNEIVEGYERFRSQARDVARRVATEGDLGGELRVERAANMWQDIADSFNLLVVIFSIQIRDLTRVTRAVAAGDLSRKVTVESGGEVLALKTLINAMVDRLQSFTAEVNRAARVTGVTSAPVSVRDVAGSWKEIADSVNSLAVGSTT